MILVTGASSKAGRALIKAILDDVVSEKAVLGVLKQGI
jgi:nucleoside-diphosphate-sugar epimerase